MFEAVGGILIDQGVREHVSTTLFKKDYSAPSSDQEKEYDEVGKETILTMSFILNGDPMRFKKRTDEIHNDHLKELRTCPIPVVAAQRLIISHSHVMVVKQKQQCVSEVAFGQMSDGDKPGYGSRRGLCHNCKEDGYHSLECRNKDKVDKTKKKDNQGKLLQSDTLSITTTVGTGSVKKESLHTMSGTETGANYDSNHEVFGFSFCTIEATTVPCVKDKNELNVEEPEKMFG